MNYTVTLAKLPLTLEEMKSMPQASLKDPADTVALTVAALCAYPSNPNECYAMLDYLRGPRPLSTMEKQFIRDRFMDGRDYIPRSYFKGAVPDNDYTPNFPYVIEFQDSVSPIAEEGYKKFDLKSGGADSMRPVMLRAKPSTGEWFLWDQILLGQIRVPKSKDAWA